MINVKTKIENDSYLLKKVSKELLDTLKQKGVEEEIIFDIYVGFEEALRNAMVHGNKLDPAKKVTVETEVTDESVTMVVEDEGEGFDPEMLPDPTRDENLLKEGGRGVFLMQHLMDEVLFEESGRRVVMKKYFNRKCS